MRGWKDLGVVETIYEEEHEDYSSSSSPSLSPTLSSPPTPLHSIVEAWSLATGHKADVLVHVQGSCFHLHKERLVRRSGYLQRNLVEVSLITLPQMFNITAETFTLVAIFCYGAQSILTPFNVAALRIAAELLQMTETDGDGDENLQQITETFFCQIIAVNREYVSIVFRSCLPLLPEAETASFLVSRCIEVLSLPDDGDDIVSCVEDVKNVDVENFEIIVNSMHQRFTRNHRLIYKIIDLYLKEHHGRMTDEEKTQICNSIDCTKLSPQLLMHAVQNPRMPLRFIVRAMFIEQLNTRRSIISATDHNPLTARPNNKEITTLGEILQRDATLRQVAQLKAAMEATSSRIQSLEKDLSGMKKILHQNDDETTNFNVLEEFGRSESLRLITSSANKGIERGHRGSSSLRFSERRDKGGSSSSESFFDDTPRIGKNIGRRLMNGLKSAFRASNSASKHVSVESKISSRDDENGDVIVMKCDQRSRLRSM